MPEPTRQADTNHTLTGWRAPVIVLATLLCALLLWPDEGNKHSSSAALKGDVDEARDNLFASLKPSSTAT